MESISARLYEHDQAEWKRFNECCREVSKAIDHLAYEGEVDLDSPASIEVEAIFAHFPETKHELELVLARADRILGRALLLKQFSGSIPSTTKNAKTRH